MYHLERVLFAVFRLDFSICRRYRRLIFLLLILLVAVVLLHSSIISFHIFLFFRCHHHRCLRHHYIFFAESFFRSVHCQIDCVCIHRVMSAHVRNLHFARARAQASDHAFA